MDSKPTVLIVPGLRDATPQHWQTLLAPQLERVVCVPPMGREDLDCGRRVAAIEAAAQSIAGPLVIAAHSAGCIMVAHWARQTRRAVQAALLATPPDFETPLPAGYPALEALRAGGWLPLPRAALFFPSLVAASRNDPLGSFERVDQLARDWGAELLDLGEVGHLNPASGHGDWPLALSLLRRLGA
jgi:predicted alpha/beta hydrolase family esterase